MFKHILTDKIQIGTKLRFFVLFIATLCCSVFAQQQQVEDKKSVNPQAMLYQEQLQRYRELDKYKSDAYKKITQANKDENASIESRSDLKLNEKRDLQQQSYLQSVERRKQINSKYGELQRQITQISKEAYSYYQENGTMDENRWGSMDDTLNSFLSILFPDIFPAEDTDEFADGTDVYSEESDDYDEYSDEYSDEIDDYDDESEDYGEYTDESEEYDDDSGDYMDELSQGESKSSAKSKIVDSLVAALVTKIKTNNSKDNEPDENFDDSDEYDETATSLESSQNVSDEIIEFSGHLQNCKEITQMFTHPYTGDKLRKYIYGLKDGLCHYVEEVPGNIKMECFYTEKKRLEMAHFYLHPERMERASIKSQTKFVEGKLVSKTQYFIDGKEVYHPMNDSLEKGECKIVSTVK